MSNIELIKKLREEMGGIGMSDCKKALDETNYNYEEAIAWLRKKGIANAAKKSSRVACEGLVALNVQGTKATIVEVNSETDFVAQNDAFKKLVLEISAKSMEMANVEELKNAQISKGTVAEAITLATAGIGEKIDLRRMDKISVTNGVIAHYIHNALQDEKTLGKIGVLVALESTGDKAKLLDFGRKLGMHIASCAPKYLTTNEVSAEEIAKEKEILVAQASGTGKPQAVIEKMVEGRMSKFYSEIVLLEQAFVMDPSIVIKNLVANFSKEIGAEVKISGFKMMKVGDGIEKQESNFADEVASML